MKTDIFNFGRVGLLFQRYFIERFRWELMYWGIMAIVFMFLRNNIPAMSGLIYVAGAFYTARFFREIHHSGNGVAYFMIPATQFEKLTVTITITAFYYFFMMIIVYVIGNLLGTFLNNILANMDFLRYGLNMNIFHHSSLQWKLFEKTSMSANPMHFVKMNMPMVIYVFRSFLFYQSIFLFGGIYFKKNQAFKTFAALIFSFLVLGILAGIEAKLILGDFTIIANDHELWLRLLADTANIIYFLLIPFLWVVSYFRLTEKQV
jgi:hypothetical protein